MERPQVRLAPCLLRQRWSLVKSPKNGVPVKCNGIDVDLTSRRGDRLSMLSAAMMLRHIREVEASNRLRDAIEIVYAEGHALTRDLGGSAST